MFILRTISKEHESVQVPIIRINNIELGNNYSIIYREVFNQEKFNFLLKDAIMPPGGYDKKSCSAIVVDSKNEFHYLFFFDDNYIMSDSGKTFEHINH